MNRSNYVQFDEISRQFLIDPMVNLDPSRDRAARVIEVKEKFPTLKHHGIAAEHFPAYINPTARLHRVDVLLLTCIVSGRGVHQTGSHRVDVGPGSVGITLQDQNHDLITEDSGLEVINLYLDLKEHPLPVLPAPLDRTLWSLLAPHPGLAHHHNQHLDLQLTAVRESFAPLHLLIREQDDVQPGQAAMMRHLLMVFLMQCCRAAQVNGWTSSVAVSAATPAWLEEIRSYLDRCYQDPIGLADLTPRAGVSAEHLCRRFKRYTGQSILAYLNNRRLQAAMWLLRTNARPITEIAHEVGFSELTYFNRVFKASTNQTPTQYRKRQPSSPREG